MGERSHTASPDWRAVMGDLHDAVQVAAKSAGLSVTEAQARARRIVARRAGAASTTEVSPRALQAVADDWLYELYELGVHIALGYHVAEVEARLSCSLVYGGTRANAFRRRASPHRAPLPSDWRGEEPPARPHRLRAHQPPPDPDQYEGGANGRSYRLAYDTWLEGRGVVPGPIAPGEGGR